MSFTSHTSAFVRLREQAQQRSQLPAVSQRATQFDLPPIWVDCKEACEQLMEQIKTNMCVLADLHASRLVVRIEDDSGNQAKDKEIDLLTKATTKKFRLAETKLGEITREAAVAGEDVVRDADLSVRVNCQRSLATSLQQLSLDFRQQQREYMQKVKLQKQQAVPSFLSSSSSSDGTASAFLLAQDELLLQEQHADVGSTRRIRERDQEVGKIAKSIEELGTIFKHLSNLVIEQGSMLDRIDQNLDMVVDRTRMGVSELEVAAAYRKSSRANYCVLFLVVMIFILFVVLMNKLE
ncbi:hypothetical protein BASA81_003973 [Batrachochytrium salamandrivorans]|nr:hypothetical protein BASA81_003973 [Batrachochytrium salamandrivorans]